MGNARLVLGALSTAAQVQHALALCDKRHAVHGVAPLLPLPGAADAAIAAAGAVNLARIGAVGGACVAATAVLGWPPPLGLCGGRHGGGARALPRLSTSLASCDRDAAASLRWPPIAALGLSSSRRGGGVRGLLRATDAAASKTEVSCIE